MHCIYFMEQRVQTGWLSYCYYFLFLGAAGVLTPLTIPRNNSRTYPILSK